MCKHWDFRSLPCKKSNGFAAIWDQWCSFVVCLLKIIFHAGQRKEIYVTNNLKITKYKNTKHKNSTTRELSMPILKVSPAQVRICNTYSPTKSCKFWWCEYYYYYLLGEMVKGTMPSAECSWAIQKHNGRYTYAKENVKIEKKIVPTALIRCCCHLHCFTRYQMLNSSCKQGNNLQNRKRCTYWFQWKKTNLCHMKAIVPKSQKNTWKLTKDIGNCSVTKWMLQAVTRETVKDQAINYKRQTKTSVFLNELRATQALDSRKSPASTETYKIQQKEWKF